MVLKTSYTIGSKAKIGSPVSSRFLSATDNDFKNLILLFIHSGRFTPGGYLGSANSSSDTGLVCADFLCNALTLLLSLYIFVHIAQAESLTLSIFLLNSATEICDCSAALAIALVTILSAGVSTGGGAGGAACCCCCTSGCCMGAAGVCCVPFPFT